MKTLILPGFSIKNKDWAEHISKELSPDVDSEVIYWDHWKTGVATKNWIEKTADGVSEKYKNQKINILAKSIGTYVTIKLLEKESSLTNKIILNGIPLEDLSSEDCEHYSILKSIPKNKMLFIQNENDNHGSYKNVCDFLHKIDNEISVISMHRNDHEYPYPNTFSEFLIEEKQGILTNLLKELDQIGLLVGEYAITGSGPLAVRNLREPHDLDIIVLPSVWDRYKVKYPVISERFETIQIGNVTILGEGSHFTNPNICPVETQVKEAEILDGHPYVQLSTLKLFKKALGREKDLNDIKLIEAYLQENR
ncbi:hypothetical protein A2380_03630 [candidate division WWE3 bacterium RIFOXYB1_FULL_43_24]|uniref:Uncharacterized protein n=1 Tax=candidate division WWE3 bacterium GW2011_GWF1_42_14 TaxID=1619138 RepID=A0A0G0YQ97_UNCKA|nr:MAG: hypothetical protein UU92_C0006G0040 [candidate division WWE3 bacterium GW2011_GWA1_42_12]KKS34391.1 MAG: hypothetical protein UU97_C0011G0027 [candidate division WWE3 bacterium GW2011_GWD1_42_14]KKS38835.1 MAG: hypothetical protein UV00_C0005G0018 [candidate division WWE3 bacterium GW2011_GWF1_42_14]KKS40533.1 MAG: hypothetical protein UV03_C0005G0019 [candidate division WWE3 bacterium GW2011_GWE1_42_16]OGC60173.1 MAG: hypothetical protein A2212_02715 [candidate division WWE3 bacterium